MIVYFVIITMMMMMMMNNIIIIILFGIPKYCHPSSFFPSCCSCSCFMLLRIPASLSSSYLNIRMAGTEGRVVDPAVLVAARAQEAEAQGTMHGLETDSDQGSRGDPGGAGEERGGGARAQGHVDPQRNPCINNPLTIH